MKKLLKIAAALVFSASSMVAIAQTQVRIGSIQSETFYMNKYMEKFQELVRQKTNNAYQFKVFYNSTLGNESEMMEQMQACPCRQSSSRHTMKARPSVSSSLRRSMESLASLQCWGRCLRRQ